MSCEHPDSGVEAVVETSSRFSTGLPRLERLSAASRGHREALVAARFRFVAGGLALCAALSACKSSPDESARRPSAPVHQVTQAATIDFDESYVVMGLRTVRLKHHIKVHSGNLGADTGLDVGLANMDLDMAVDAANGNKVFGNKVKLHADALVSEVYYKDDLDPEALKGTPLATQVSATYFPLFPVKPVLPLSTPGTGPACEVLKRQSATATLTSCGSVTASAPGNYGDVRVRQNATLSFGSSGPGTTYYMGNFKADSGATVFFGEGVYHFKNFRAEKDVEVNFGGPTDFIVANKFRVGQGGRFNPAVGSGVLPERVRIYVRGSDGPHPDDDEDEGEDTSVFPPKPRVARVGQHSEFRANILTFDCSVSPCAGGTIHIRHHSEAVGSFFGHDVVIGHNTQLTNRNGLVGSGSGEPPVNAEDVDNDGIPNVNDNCLTVPNFDQTDGDGDGIGDACDNCPTVFNAVQEDDDENGIGNACEATPGAYCGDGVVDTSRVPPEQCDLGAANCDGVGCTCDTTCQLIDSTCTSDGECNDLDPCNGTETCVAGACQPGTPLPDGQVCRASAGACDVAEVCTAGACPADGFQGAGTECRASTGACDVAETCSGSSATCPADGFASAGTECRASAGACDVAETCTGSGVACPADGFAPAGTQCRASTGVCDVAESCSGSAATCPVDGFVAAGTLCRAAAGPCDVAESCSGSGGTCPPDGFVPSGTQCRAAVGPCDVAESCSGASAACPADGLAAAGTVCRAAAGLCDVAETCSGSSTSCPADGLAGAGTVCRAAAGACDVAESCDGLSASCPADGFVSAGTECRASTGTCDPAESCNGSAAACPADAAFGECDGNSGTTCETDLRTLENCGACGATCSLPFATATCATGTCEIATCQAGFADCDGVASNGCEVSLDTSTSNCGSCGNVCPNPIAGAHATCNGGGCGIACDESFQTICGGSCVSTQTDDLNCGGCGITCTGGGECINGQCVDCRVTTGACSPGEQCDSATGTCICSGSSGCSGTCSNGACCPLGYTSCGSTCVDTDSDTTHCGSCGVACATGETCQGGVCSTPGPTGPPAVPGPPIPGSNVDMVSGLTWPDGDPFQQRQNEGSIAASTLNPEHLLAAAIDWRTVDIPESPGGKIVKDAWVAVYRSYNGGRTWKSTLLPGYPADQTAQGLASALKGRQFVADPVVRSGPDGRFYLTIIGGDRDAGVGVYVARFKDDNQTEAGEPIRYIDTTLVEPYDPTRTLDKPWIAVDVPRGSACENVYVAYSEITDFAVAKILFAKSTWSGTPLDCNAPGALSFSTPQTLSSGSGSLNLGTSLAIGPQSGNIYLSWRVFQFGTFPNAIRFARSTDFGATWTLKDIATGFTAFDQPTTGGTFRAPSFPAVAADAEGYVHVVWPQLNANGWSRLHISSALGGVGWSAPREAVPTLDPLGNDVPGHQFFQGFTFGAGKLMLVFFGNYLDQTRGVYTLTGDGRFTETREYLGLETAKGIHLGQGGFIDENVDGLAKRHTIDIYAATGSTGSNPTFGSRQIVSQYAIGKRPGSEVVEQLQFNASNLPLFQGGTVPFMGDYLDVSQAPPMVPCTAADPCSTGQWRFATKPTDRGVFHALWPDNRLVRPPADGDWTNYTPTTEAGGTSIYDPTQTAEACVPGQAGMRNQTMMSSLISNGLVVGSLGNAKPVDNPPGIQRAFTIYVKNATPKTRSFHLAITYQTAGAQASFLQNDPTQTTLDLTIAGGSTQYRTVFVGPTGTPPIVTVSVTENNPPLGAAPLMSSLILRGDKGPIDQPTTVSSPDIATEETYNPSLVFVQLSSDQTIITDVTSLDLALNFYDPVALASNLTSFDPTLASTDVQNATLSSPLICTDDTCAAIVCGTQGCTPVICSNQGCAPLICGPDGCAAIVCGLNGCAPLLSCRNGTCSPVACPPGGCSPLVCGVDGSGNSKCAPLVCGPTGCLPPETCSGSTCTPLQCPNGTTVEDSGCIMLTCADTSTLDGKSISEALDSVTATGGGNCGAITCGKEGCAPLVCDSSTSQCTASVCGSEGCDPLTPGPGGFVSLGNSPMACGPSGCGAMICGPKGCGPLVCNAAGCTAVVCGAGGCTSLSCGTDGCASLGYAPIICGPDGCSPLACGPTGCAALACGPDGCTAMICSGDGCAPLVCGPDGCGRLVCGDLGCGPLVCSGTSCAPNVCNSSVCVQQTCPPGGCTAKVCGDASCSPAAYQDLAPCDPTTSTCAPLACGPSGCAALACGPSGCQSLSCTSTDCAALACGPSGCQPSGSCGSDPSCAPLACGPDGCSTISCGDDGCGPLVCGPDGCAALACGPTGCAPLTCGPTGCAALACGPTGCAPLTCGPDGCAALACGPSGCGAVLCGAQGCAPLVCGPSGCGTLVCDSSGCGPLVCGPSGCQAYDENGLAFSCDSTNPCTGLTCDSSGGCAPLACGPSGCAALACGPQGCAALACGPSGCSSVVCGVEGCGPISCGPDGCAALACGPSGCAPLTCGPSGCTALACGPDGCSPVACGPSGCAAVVCGVEGCAPLTCGPSGCTALAPGSTAPLTCGPSGCTTLEGTAPLTCGPSGCGSIAEVTFQYTNTGNTSASYSPNIVGSLDVCPADCSGTSTDPAFACNAGCITVQSYTWKAYSTPVVTSGTCSLDLSTQAEVFSHVGQVNLTTDLTSVADPGLLSSDDLNQQGTCALAPGESCNMTFRFFLPPGATISQPDPGSTTFTVTLASGESYTVSPVVVAQAPNTGETEPSNSAENGPPILMTEALATAWTGTTFSQPVDSIGGTLPLVYGVSGLPSGLTLTQTSPTTALISGQPDQNTEGTYEVTIFATDSSAPAKIAETYVLLTVKTGIRIVTSALPDFRTGALCLAETPAGNTTQLRATGGLLPHTWANSLCAGCVSTTGLVNVPCTSGSANAIALNVAFRVDDAGEGFAVKQYLQTYVDEMRPGALVTTGSPEIEFSVQLQAAGGRPPYHWQFTSVVVPTDANLSLSSDGVLSSTSGVPTGTLSMGGTAVVTDSSCFDSISNCTRQTKTISVTVSASAPPPTDTNRNGITDSQETDPDGDGYTGWQESAFGTGESDSNSYPVGQLSVQKPAGSVAPNGYIGGGTPGAFLAGGFAVMNADDNRFVAFLTKDSLDSLRDFGGNDIYLYDIANQTATPRLVSANSAGVKANTDSSFPSITADGRYVVFSSNATNLGPDDYTFNTDIFMADTCFGAEFCVPSVRRISGTSEGGTANGNAKYAQVSADGRYVAFMTDATNILPGTHEPGAIYIRDTCVGPTASTGCVPKVGLISECASGDGCRAHAFSMTPDAKFVAYSSTSDQIVLPDTNGVISDVYVAEISVGSIGDPAGCVVSTNRVSVDSTGSQRLQHSGYDSRRTGLAGTEPPRISADGRFVAFSSEVDGLTSILSSLTDSNALDIFVRDTQTATTYPVSELIDDDGSSYTDGFSMDAAGQYLAFSYGDASTGSYMVRVVDLSSLITALGSTPPATLAAGQGLFTASSFTLNNCLAPFSSLLPRVMPVLSADGKFILVDQGANGLWLAANAACGSCAGLSDGTPCSDGNHCTTGDACQANVCVPTGTAPNGTICRPQTGLCDIQETCDGLSTTCPPDGVESSTTLCRPKDGTCDVDEFCDGTSKSCPTDLFAPATTVCRASAGACDPHELCTGSAAACPADVLSPSGTACVPFCDPTQQSLCTGSDPQCPGTGPLCQLTGASVTPTGSAGNGASLRGVLSGDGRYLVFESDADNLVSDDTNPFRDIFVRDRVAGVTQRVNVSSSGAESTGGGAERANISPDGRFVVFTTLASNLSAVDTNGVRDVYLHDRDVSGDGTFDQTGDIATTLISTDFSGGPADNLSSSRPSISDDGRYIAFDSQATDLTGATDTNGILADVFVRDTCQGALGCTPATSLVGLSYTGAQPVQLAGLPNYETNAISADGRYVLFLTVANNMVLGDTTGILDAFVRDTCVGATGCTPTTTRVSLASDGSAPTGPTFRAAISRDGRFVAFASQANNLVPGDGNGSNGSMDVFVRDTCVGATGCTPTTTRVSLDSNGNEVSVGGGDAAISGDGRFVVFVSNGLVSGDTNGVLDVYVHDRATGKVALVSGVAEYNTGLGDLGVGATLGVVSISGDGRFIAFSSDLALPLSGPPPHTTDGQLDMFVAPNPLFTRCAGLADGENCDDGNDCTVGETCQAGICTAGSPAASGTLCRPAVGSCDLTETCDGISPFCPADGKVTAGTECRASAGLCDIAETCDGTSSHCPPDVFSSGTCNPFCDQTSEQTCTGDSPNCPTDTAPLCQFATISVPNGGGQASDESFVGNVSSDGRFVMFFSDAANLVAGDTNASRDVFVHDRSTGTTSRVSVDSAGVQGNGASVALSISADGRYVAFASDATNLVAGDTNASSDVFVHDRNTGATSRVSVTSGGVQGNATSEAATISGDGRYVAFASDATNLVAGDTNALEDIFVHDRNTGATTRVSVASGGGQALGGVSSGPVVSADGRYVAFYSWATNLVAGDTNGASDVFVHDRNTGVTTRVSVDSAGGQGDADSLIPAISADGRYVSYWSGATNLVPGDTNANIDIFVHDRNTGQTTRVSVDSAGGEALGLSFGTRISENGRYVVFESSAENLVSGDSNGFYDTFVHDRTTGQTARVSVGPGGSGAATPVLPWMTTISGDGRFVIFTSEQPLALGDTNGFSDLFVAPNPIFSPR